MMAWWQALCYTVLGTALGTALGMWVVRRSATRANDVGKDEDEADRKESLADALAALEKEHGAGAAFFVVFWHPWRLLSAWGAE